MEWPVVEIKQTTCLLFNPAGLDVIGRPSGRLHYRYRNRSIVPSKTPQNRWSYPSLDGVDAFSVAALEDWSNQAREDDKGARLGTVSSMGSLRGLLTLQGLGLALSVVNYCLTRVLGRGQTPHRPPPWHFL